MAFTIVIKPYHKDIAELRTMLENYQLDGGRIYRGPNQDRLLPFDNEGELEFTQDQYEDLRAVSDIRFENGNFYYIFTELEIDNHVPAAWPNCRNADGDIYQYQEYFCARQYKLDDGTYLFKIQRRDQANPTGAFLLTDAERKVFEEELGTLLVRSKGEALIPKVEVEA